MKKIITIACHKGGVGKTATALAFANLLASSGKKVLLMDLDPQFNLTNTYMESAPEDNIYTAMVEASRARKGTVVNLPIYEVGKNLDLVPASLDVAAIDIVLSTVTCRELILKKLIEPVKDSYDYIIMDTASLMGFMLTNALVASTDVIIPVVPDGYVGTDIGNVLDMMEPLSENLNPDLNFAGIVLTKFRPTRKVDNIVRDIIQQEFPSKLCKTTIGDYVCYKEATLARQDIVNYKPNSKAVSDYAALIKELLKVNVKL